MSGETDKLINLASQVSDNPDPREMDMLVSTGERVTIALLSMAIQALGYKAQSFTGRQAGIISDSVHTKARIEKMSTDRITQVIKDGGIAVIAGFQGIDEHSDVTTLGRGGSDLTAVAIAAAGVGVSSPAWASPKPTITLTNSGSPNVTGSNFTANGPVVLTEWAVGTKKPIVKESENARSDGTILFYLNCDGQQSVYFRAKDVTTHKKSNKTTPAVLVCIN